MGSLLYGVKPVIIAVVAQALWNLGRTALNSAPLVGLGLAAILLGLLGLNELLLRLGGGLAMLMIQVVRGEPRSLPGLFTPLMDVTSAGSLASSIAIGFPPVTLGTLFLFFLNCGTLRFH